MDRQVVIQVVAMLVVLAALLRWIPGDDPQDPLGRGMPQLTLMIDDTLAGLGDPLASRAYLRSLRYRDQSFYLRWKRQLQKVARAQGQAEADPDLFVQFKGMPRNDQWMMTYDLYPIPTTGPTYEDGGSADDETLPGAFVFVGNLVRPDEMTPEQRENYELMRQHGERAFRADTLQADLLRGRADEAEGDEGQDGGR